MLSPGKPQGAASGSQRACAATKNKSKGKSQMSNVKSSRGAAPPGFSWAALRAAAGAAGATEAAGEWLGHRAGERATNNRRGPQRICQLVLQSLD